MSAPATSVVLGISGATQNAAAALVVDGELRACCEQERVTRVRGAGLRDGQLPDEALEAVLQCEHLTRSAVTGYVAAEPQIHLPQTLPALWVDHHQAHAATAFYLSPFESAAVLVCDQQRHRPMSAWLATPDGLRDQEWVTSGHGLASLYSECAALFGFPAGSEHQLEALARINGGVAAIGFERLISYDDGVSVSPDWKSQIADRLSQAGQSLQRRSEIAAGFQRRLGDVLTTLLGDLRGHSGARYLALGGGLFYNTALTTIVRQSGIFEDVFVAPNPGNAGIAVGAALGSGGRQKRTGAAVSPFLGPEFDAESIKRTLDNCKLSYDVVDERDLIDGTVRALVRGELVGWFQGRMEWGHRALGNRSILASPLSRYVLENLNVYLKHRERHRTYGVSIPVERSAEFFTGPPESRFMEYEYAPLDPDRFRELLPEGARSLRVQTIPAMPDAGSSELFRRLHQRFGEATGVPILINTSFNGFREPMVCSPRDAVRVFFGSGLDRLVIGRFVIRK